MGKMIWAGCLVGLVTYAGALESNKQISFDDGRPVQDGISKESLADLRNNIKIVQTAKAKKAPKPKETCSNADKVLNVLGQRMASLQSQITNLNIEIAKIYEKHYCYAGGTDCNDYKDAARLARPLESERDYAGSELTDIRERWKKIMVRCFGE